MKTITVNATNKSYITKRYIDYIVSRMDETDVWENFKNYLYKEKIKYPIDTLISEIKRHCPHILEEHISESVVSVGEEYSEFDAKKNEMLL